MNVMKKGGKTEEQLGEYCMSRLDVCVHMCWNALLVGSEKTQRSCWRWVEGQNGSWWNTRTILLKPFDLKKNIK